MHMGQEFGGHLRILPTTVPKKFACRETDLEPHVNQQRMVTDTKNSDDTNELLEE